MKTTHAAAADEAATASPDNPLRYLPLEDILESCTHVQRARRARYSDQGLDELAESINRSGVLQPILVRPFNGSHIARSTDGAPPSFEIVAGERRFLASKRAGLRQIPAIVRELTDEHVLEAQLVENLQREDLDALSEAEGYDELMRVARIDVDQVAAKIGKSRSYVYARTKLLDLSDEGRAALAAGKLDASRALLVARIRDPKQQAKALELALEMDWRGDRPAYSYRGLVEQIGRKKATVPLSEATFPTADETLQPGPCTTCPHRTGNCAAPGLDEDPNVCTDVRCFNAKTREANARRLKAAEAAGLQIIKGDEAAELVKSAASLYRVTNVAGYVDLDAKCDDDRFQEPEPENTGDDEAHAAAYSAWHERWDAHEPRTYRQILGEDAKPTAAFIDPSTRRTLELMPVDDVRRLLKAHGIELSAQVGAVAGPKIGYDSKEWARKQAEALERRKKVQAFRMKVAQAIFANARSDLDDAELTDIAKRLGDSWAARDILPKFYGGKAVPGSMTTVDRCRFIRFALLARELTQEGLDDRAKMLDALANRFSVDMAAIKAELEGKTPKASTKKAAAKKTARPKPKAAPAKKATKAKAAKVKK